MYNKKYRKNISLLVFYLTSDNNTSLHIGNVPTLGAPRPSPLHPLPHFFNRKILYLVSECQIKLKTLKIFCGLASPGPRH